VQRFDAEGPADYEEFGADEFGESFPGWADLIGVNFPDGIPDDVALNQVVAVVNEVLFPDWTRRQMPWKEGGLYCIPSDDGSYGIVKVLKVDSVGVHIRRYSNRFDQPPAQVEESELLLGAFDADADSGFGVGHLPVSARTFHGWSPTFVQQSTVQPDELTGYQGWLEAEGGYF
jgi:hypothetical protein